MAVMYKSVKHCIVITRILLLLFNVNNIYTVKYILCTATASPNYMNLINKQKLTTFVIYFVPLLYKSFQIQQKRSCMNSDKTRTKIYPARWLRGNARDSLSGGPGFKSGGRPTWLRFLVVSSIFKIAKELVVFQRQILLLIQYLMFTVSQELKPLLSKW